jgi:hypothetical protein
MFTQIISITLGSLLSISELLPFISNGTTHGILHFFLSKKIKNDIEKFEDDIEEIYDDVMNPNEHSHLNKKKNKQKYNTHDDNSLSSSSETSSDSCNSSINKYNNDHNKDNHNKVNDKHDNDKDDNDKDDNDKYDNDKDDIYNRLDDILTQFTEYKIVSEKINLGQLDMLEKINDNINSSIDVLSNKLNNINNDNLLEKMNHIIEYNNEKSNNDHIHYKKILHNIDKIDSCEYIKKLDDSIVKTRTELSLEMNTFCSNILNEIKTMNNIEWEDVLNIILQHLQDVQRKNLETVSNDEYKTSITLEKIEEILNELRHNHNEFNKLFNKIDNIIEVKNEDTIKHIKELKTSFINQLNELENKMDTIKKKK